jgi:hypothetical protein
MNGRKIRWGVMEWIDLDKNTEQSTAFVNTVMNFLIHKMVEISCVDIPLAVSEERLVSMEIVS